MKWRDVPLGDICSLVNGRAFREELWSTTGFPIIRIQNLNGKGAAFNHWDGPLDSQILVEPGDLLLAWSGTPGTSFGAHIWHGPRGVLNQHIFRVDLDRRQIDPVWAVRAINHQLDHLIRRAHGGVGLKHVTRSTVQSLLIPLPLLDEQRRIAAILDKADGLRQKRRAALQKLDSLTQSLFLDMFGDPVSNSKGWPLTTLGDIISEFRYGTSNKSTGSGNPTLRIPNVIGGALDLSELKLVPVGTAELRRLKLEKGDLLFVRSNGNQENVGRCAVFEPQLLSSTGYRAEDFIFASYLIRGRIASNSADPFFLREFLLGDEGRRQLKRLSKTSAGQFNINIESLSAIRVIHPPLSLQIQFARRVATIQSLRTRYEATLAGTVLQFDSLQYRAFRGEL